MQARTSLVGAFGLVAALGLAGAVAHAAPYESLTIVQPLNDETVHDNAGSVHVVTRLRPALRDGDGIEIRLDGKTVSRRASTSIDVEGVERGTHELQARVVAPGGEVLVSSPSVTFHMWQASRLFRNRRR